MTNLPASPSGAIRILLDCRMASWTGVGRYSVGLARALACRDDVEVVVVLAAGEASPVPGAEVHVAERRPFAVEGARELGRILRAVAPDVMHCLHFPTPSPVRHPLVVTMHDVSPLVLPGIMPSRVKRAAYRALNMHAVQVADRICVPSLFTGAEVTRIFPAARRKTRVTPEAADDFSAGARSKLEGPLATLAEQPYLLSMGSTRVHKDLPMLLRAFARLAPAHPDLRLLLVGADAPGYVAERLPDSPDSVRERVAFTGRVTDGELRTLYADAAVFAFPSRYEGFGLPPLEAMALGTPVVVADAASLPEVVAEAASYAPVGNDEVFAAAIGDILGDAALRERHVAAGLARAAELTWERTAEATVAVYREVLGS